MAKNFKFTVTGKARFPVDMLRYDSCYPADSDSVSEITKSIRQEVRKTFVVTLISNYQPTIARWESFSWSLVN